MEEIKKKYNNLRLGIAENQNEIDSFQERIDYHNSLIKDYKQRIEATFVGLDEETIEKVKG